MLKNGFFILVLMLAFSSCKKDKTLYFSIHGVVTDESFNKGMDNATVIVYEKAIASYDYTEVGRIKTDSDGKYELKFPRNRVEGYRVTIQKDFYFDKSYTIDFASLDPKKSIEYNFGTTAYSWVKIHLQNSGDVNSYDDFIYKKTQGHTDCAACCPTGVETHFYGALDTTFYCLTDGNKPFAYFYQLGNTSTIGTNQQTTIPFDTIVLTTTY
jgi:hypothetical protein